MSAVFELPPNQDDATDQQLQVEAKMTPRESWFEGVDRFLQEQGHDTRGALLPQESQKHFSEDIITYIDTDLAKRKPDEIRLPDQLVRHRLSRYYDKYLSLYGTDSDTVRNGLLLRFQRHNLEYDHTYKERFRQVRLAFDLEEMYQEKGFDGAAQATLAVLIAYGMTLQTLQTIRENAGGVVSQL